MYPAGGCGGSWTDVCCEYHNGQGLLQSRVVLGLPARMSHLMALIRIPTPKAARVGYAQLYQQLFRRRKDSDFDGACRQSPREQCIGALQTLTEAEKRGRGERNSRYDQILIDNVLRSFMINNAFLIGKRAGGLDLMTSREFAELIGVSQATVSRALNGRSSVCEKTRIYIEKKAGGGIRFCAQFAGAQSQNQQNEYDRGAFFRSTLTA